MTEEGSFCVVFEDIYCDPNLLVDSFLAVNAFFLYVCNYADDSFDSFGLNTVWDVVLGTDSDFSVPDLVS